jgi:hypothetical protein
MKPGTLVVDGGTIDMTGANGIKELTVSAAVTPGLYWLGSAGQGAPATAPKTRQWTTLVNPAIPHNASSAAAYRAGLQSSGVTGAFASAPTLGVAMANRAPRMQIRLS